MQRICIYFLSVLTRTCSVLIMPHILMWVRFLFTMVRLSRDTVMMYIEYVSNSLMTRPSVDNISLIFYQVLAGPDLRVSLSRQSCDTVHLMALRREYRAGQGIGAGERKEKGRCCGGVEGEAVREGCWGVQSGSLGGGGGGGIGDG